MRPGRFFWKLFLGNAALLGLTLGLSIWLIVAEFDRFQADQVTPYLHDHAETLAALFEARLASDTQFRIESTVTRIASSHPEAIRVTIIGSSGEVLADSHEDAAKMENHLSRPEIQQAMQSGRGESQRWSDTIGRTMKYVAIRVDRNAAPVGIVRVAMPVRTLAERTSAARRLLGPIGGVALLSALGLAIGLAFLWSNRIRRITAAAQSLSRGDLATAIPISGSDEVSMLARALERMRNRITSHMTAINNQRRTWESLVHELSEGVVVADLGGNIILANPAAGRLLQYDFPISGFMAHSKCGVEECISNHDLQQMLLGKTPTGPERNATQGVFGEDAYLSAIRLDVGGPSNPAYVLARVREISIPSPVDLPGTGAMSQQTMGRLLVLTEVTEVVRAVRARNDFVTNSSHELRTPVAAIRVAVETVLKMDLQNEAPAATRFLGVIGRHAARLEALVNDLLDLARVEAPGARYDPSSLHLQRVVDELRARWDEELARKNLVWRADVNASASQVTASPQLLSLVLDNLMDNAIKFTPPEGEISVRTMAEDSRVIIEVSDTGCGIPARDQDRVFERFYQVDAVRGGSSSDKRGTGLGLSIVRHAVLAMGGTVALSSKPGEGTSVRVELPKIRP